MDRAPTYTIRNSIRVARGVPRVARQRMASHAVAAMANPATAYTSASLEFCHTVNVNADTTTATAAPPQVQRPPSAPFARDNAA